MTRLSSLALSVILTVLSGVPSQQRRQQGVSIPSIVGASRVLFPDTGNRRAFTVVIEEESEIPEPHFPDFFVLRVETVDDESNSELASLKFESTYGKFDLCLVDTTGDGLEEFILITGENRGTSVREEMLRVYQRHRSEFVQILSTSQSGFFGSGSQWRYRRQYSDVNGDGVIDLAMTLEHDPIDKDNRMQDPTLIPKERVKTFTYDAETKRMKLNANR